MGLPTPGQKGLGGRGEERLVGKKAQLKQTRSSLLACRPRQAPLQQRGPVRKGLRPAPLSPGASSQWRPCPQPGRAAGWHRVPRDGAFPGPADNLGPVPFPPGEKLSPREGGRGCRVFGGIQLPPLQGGPDWSHWDVIYSPPRAAGGAAMSCVGEVVPHSRAFAITDWNPRV